MIYTGDPPNDVRLRIGLIDRKIDGGNSLFPEKYLNIETYNSGPRGCTAERDPRKLHLPCSCRPTFAAHRGNGDHAPNDALEIRDGLVSAARR
jgi:hypothetical protein